MNIIDAEWTLTKGERDPVAYSRKCHRIQREKRRRRIAYAQRLLIGAWLVLAVAVGVALFYI